MKVNRLHTSHLVATHPQHEILLFTDHDSTACIPKCDLTAHTQMLRVVVLGIQECSQFLAASWEPKAGSQALANWRALALEGILSPHSHCKSSLGSRSQMGCGPMQPAEMGTAGVGEKGGSAHTPCSALTSQMERGCYCSHLLSRK